MPEPRESFSLSPEYQRAIIAGLVLGIVAAGLVWWLERFETRRVIGEVEQYLRTHDAFEDYYRRREGSA